MNFSFGMTYIGRLFAIAASGDPGGVFFHLMVFDGWHSTDVFNFEGMM